MNQKYVMLVVVCFIVLISIIQCSQWTYIPGQHYPELADPEAVGTILFFYLENLELYQAKSAFFDDLEETEQFINRLNIDLNLLQEEYPSLRIDYVDISQKPDSPVMYKIYKIPTLILFDQAGHEVRRWIPRDLKRGGGTRWEIKKTIEKINILLR